ncbi:hypothetical protein HETIRDRAFT_475577 [Heterobasidion irregulare TC 32-1]|uniref:DUF6533 domain-containing protein n=1 Tax=Heterobasidion irregulare (strain TC 32-1) TaxID=747525 RepID=W4KAJ7_HETIT|nr:uncharacterized protein HETIRDRAFT_475577 [Heterobasidion irregulare TC 32-1]ETW82111.1 hypothetical protein HETIRDRAFT_475577 [Heterobasidion irregulare TC 32-1]
MTSNLRDDILADIVNLYLTECFGLASFVVMMWDHLLTLSDEVTFIWLGRKGLYIYLYFVNRYFIPLSFIVNLYAYFGRSWTQESCNHFVRYEGSMTMIGVYIAAFLMLFRLVALYHGNKYVQVPVFAILFAAIAVNAWLLSRGQGVSQSSSLVHSCTMIFDPSLGPVAACAAILPLVYDTVICVLVIARLVHWRGSRETGNLQSTLMKEGLSYYFFGCSVMLASTFTIVYADPSARNIAMQ